MNKYIFLLPLLLLSGCGTPNGLGYPASYTEQNLPQYPTAWVTNQGANTSTPAGKVQLRLRSRDSIDQIQDFYREELTAAGWTEIQQDGEFWPGFAVTIYTKEDEQLQLITEQQGREVSIGIVLSDTQQPPQ